MELIIVMAILGILFVMLLRTYNRIATMVFRVQQEKEVNQEILQISQLIQNFSDRNTIDYAKYDPLWTGSLLVTKWITDVLYLTGQDGHLSFFSSGTNCVDPAIEYDPGVSSGCSLYMMDNTNTPIALLNSKKIVISKVVFKVIPFASQEQYLLSSSFCATGDYLHCLNSPWFRVIFKAYSVNYGRQRATHVAIPFQQFF